MKLIKNAAKSIKAKLSKTEQMLLNRATAAKVAAEQMAPGKQAKPAKSSERMAKVKAPAVPASYVGVRPLKRGEPLLLALGTKGTMFTNGVYPTDLPLNQPVEVVWAGFRKGPVSAKGFHDTQAAGKRLPESHSCYDLGCHVSQRVEKFMLVTLPDALKRKLVRPQKFAITSAGKTRTVLGYVLNAYKAAQKAPQYVATEACPAGRFETLHINDGRNENPALLFKAKAV